MIKKFWFVIVILMVGLACNIGAPKTEEASVVPTSVAAPGVAAPADQVAQPEAIQEVQPTDTPVPTPTSIPSKPVGIWEGLSSLNSYRMTIKAVANGPSAQDRSEMTYTFEVGSDGDSSHVRTENLSSSADDPEVSTSASDLYRVGDRSCEVDEDGESEVTDDDPMAQEMLSAWVKLVDMVPMTNDAVFVGEEEMYGVRSNHFTFTVSGLGDESGAEVVASTGDYWLAQDGQYVVKYLAVLETRNGPADSPETKTMHTEFRIDLQDVNQNIVISMPAQCQ